MQTPAKTALVLLTSSLFISAGSALAAPRHPAPQNEAGLSINPLLQGAVSISFNGARFFFRAGHYYKMDHGTYVKVAPPIGIVVPHLPASRSIEYIDGEKFFVVHDTYYRRTPNGFTVVKKPAPIIIVHTEPKAPRANDPKTVWIDNSNGSRTPVELVPVEDGQWRGPKGEYYPEFPSLEQLKPVYGLPDVQTTEPAVQEPETQTVWISNENGSKTPVELTRQDGDSWTGPNGEIYTSLPTEEDLRPAYGLQAD